MEVLISNFIGDGSGNGSGDGSGNGSGYGSGYGSGSGYGDGSGDGSGDGYNIKTFNGEKVYIIDYIPTIIESIKGNVAKGFILKKDLTLEPTFIVKDGIFFAHGTSLHEAFDSLKEKIYADCSIDERISKFKDKFADFSIKYPAKELFSWHHVLTGSCKQGRLNFIQEKGIDIENDSFTIYEFISLTENNYGGHIIKQLKQ